MASSYRITEVNFQMKRDSFLSSNIDVAKKKLIITFEKISTKNLFILEVYLNVFKSILLTFKYLCFKIPDYVRKIYSKIYYKIYNHQTISIHVVIIVKLKMK